VSLSLLSPARMRCRSAAAPPFIKRSRGRPLTPSGWGPFSPPPYIRLRGLRCSRFHFSLLCLTLAVGDESTPILHSTRLLSLGRLALGTNHPDGLSLFGPAGSGWSGGRCGNNPLLSWDAFFFLGYHGHVLGRHGVHLFFFFRSFACPYFVRSSFSFV